MCQKHTDGTLLQMVSASAATQPITDARELWQRIQDTYSSATASGAATSIDNRAEVVHSAQSNIDFVLRVAEALKKKPPAQHACVATTVPSLSRCPHRHIAHCLLTFDLQSYV